MPPVLSFSVEVLDALEEHDFHFAGIVADQDGKPVRKVVPDLLSGDFRPVLREEADPEDRTDDLDISLVRPDVGDFLDRAPVDVAEGVQV